MARRIGDALGVPSLGHQEPAVEHDGHDAHDDDQAEGQVTAMALPRRDRTRWNRWVLSMGRPRRVGPSIHHSTMSRSLLPPPAFVPTLIADVPVRIALSAMRNEPVTFVDVDPVRLVGALGT